MTNFDPLMILRGSAAQIFRYALVGTVINLVGYLIYLIFTSFGSTPKVTMTILYVAGAAIGFIGNRSLTFADHGNLFGSSIRYFAAHVFGYLINFLILLIFVDILGYQHQLVQAVAIFIVAGFLFIAFKLFVFHNPSASRFSGP